MTNRNTKNVIKADWREKEREREGGERLKSCLNDLIQSGAMSDRDCNPSMPEHCPQKPHRLSEETCSQGQYMPST